MSTIINAGRIAPIPKGLYNASTQYAKLDIVTFSNESYICKQACKGIAPTNGDYWQLLAGSAGGGKSIVSVTLTSSVGLVDTYTITYTDATTSTFQVTNGKDGEDGTDGTDGRGIISITKTASHGLIDTYTIVYSDRTTSTYQVTNGANGTNGTDGRGITSITKTGTSGLVDTYTITYTDGTTSTYQVTNGEAGQDAEEDLMITATKMPGANNYYNLFYTWYELKQRVINGHNKMYVQLTLGNDTTLKMPFDAIDTDDFLHFSADVQEAGDSKVIHYDLLYGDDGFAILTATHLQDALMSGSNIKTINNTSVLGSGNIAIPAGKSAYQSYVDTTTDVPVKTEAEWVASLKGADGVDLGEAVLINDLTTGGATNVLSAEMGKVLNNKIEDLDAVETSAVTNYAYPEIFGNYGLNNAGTALNAVSGNWCTQPMLVKSGETIKSPFSTKYTSLATVTPPLTASSAVVRVDNTGNTARQASYTNNTLADVYVICVFDRSLTFSYGGFIIETSTTEQYTFPRLNADIDNVGEILSPPKTDNVTVTVFANGQMNVALSGEHVGTYYKSSNASYSCISNPIQLVAGDTLHVKLNTAANEFHFLKLEEGETQTTSTYYPGLKTKLKATDLSLQVNEDLNVVLMYTTGTLVSAYIEHSSVNTLSQSVGYSAIADASIVENADSDVCLIMGSSLTYSGYAPKTLSWIERLNDLVDIGIVNGGHSGANLSGNITDMTTGVINLPNISLKTLNPRYIISNNDANSTPTGKNLDTILRQFEMIAKSVGATCLVCGEEPTLISAKNYNKQASMTKQGVNYYPSVMLWYNLNRSQLDTTLRNNNQVYTGWLTNDMVHSNAKNGSSHIRMEEMLSQLYIHKSIKFYKVRENYKAGTPTTSELVYNNNFERAAIWRGTCPAIGSGTSPWANDNIDGTGYIDGETQGVDLCTDTNISCEVMTAKGGGKVTFYKHALVEIITPRVQVSKATITMDCSAEPTAVGYIANGSYVSITPTYSSSVLTIEINDAGLQDYDKIRLIVSNTTDASFTLAKVKAIVYDGHIKPSFDVKYKGRKIGKELMTATSVASGWTFSGNGSVKQMPAAVRLYTSLNNVANHIQLDDDSATASYTQQLDHNVQKVAVRIAATIFPPLQTLRASNEYTTTTQNLFRGMYYGGNLLLTINNAYIPLHIEFGWTEVYAEAIIDGDSLDITLGRATAFDADNYNVGSFPVFIHNVSVQEID